MADGPGDAAAGAATGLNVLDDPCRGCGACCGVVGAPPGYSFAYPTGEEPPEGWDASDDARAWRAMPAEIRSTLDDYYRAVREGAVRDREVYAEPCVWYDPVASRCAHYAWRPTACREFEAGGDDCRGIKEYAWRS